MLTALLVILAVAYVVLKVINTRADFAERDAAREAAEAEAAEELEELEELEEEEEIRRNAVDVDAETIETPEPEDVAFSVEEADELAE